MTFAEDVARADRDVLDALGEPVIYQPTVGAAVPVTGVFAEQYQLAKGGGEAGVGALGPAVFLRLEDLPLDPEDDDEPTVTIRGIAYHVVGPPHRDEVGGAALVLRRITT